MCDFLTTVRRKAKIKKRKNGYSVFARILQSAAYLYRDLFHSIFPRYLRSGSAESRLPRFSRYACESYRTDRRAEAFSRAVRRSRKCGERIDSRRLIRKNSAEDADTATEKGFLPGVIVFTKNLASLAVDGENIFAFAGVKGRDLVTTATAAGLTGAEFLTGIPCSVGGATYMNAGAKGRHVSDAIESVLSYGTGEMRVRSVSECAFGYKDSVFMKNGEIILGVTFRLKRAGVSLAEANVKIAAEARKNCLRERASAVF